MLKKIIRAFCRIALSIYDSLEYKNIVLLQCSNPTQRIKLETHGPETEHVSRKLQSVGNWEPTETKCVESILRPGDFALDVGANIGYYSVLMNHLVGSSGKIVALEPDADNFRLLKRNVCRNNSYCVQTIQAGAAATKGFGTLYRSESNFGDHRIFASSDLTEAGKIRTVTLSSIIKTVGYAPQLVKIDCQGAEHEIICGLQDALRDPLLRPSSMILELWPYGLSESGSSHQEFLRSLLEFDYLYWNIGRWSAIPEPTDLDELMELCDTELKISTKLFTNVLMIDKRNIELADRIEELAKALAS